LWTEKPTEILGCAIDLAKKEKKTNWTAKTKKTLYQKKGNYKIEPAQRLLLRRQKTTWRKKYRRGGGGRCS